MILNDLQYIFLSDFSGALIIITVAIFGGEVKSHLSFSFAMMCIAAIVYTVNGVLFLVYIGTGRRWWCNHDNHALFFWRGVLFESCCTWFLLMYTHYEKTVLSGVAFLVEPSKQDNSLRVLIALNEQTNNLYRCMIVYYLYRRKWYVLQLTIINNQIVPFVTGWWELMSQKQKNILRFLKLKYYTLHITQACSDLTWYIKGL